MVNSGPDAEAFPQELTTYTEETTSQRIPPMIYIEGVNQETRPTRILENKKPARIHEICKIVKQMSDKQLIKVHYQEDIQSPSIQGILTANSPTAQEYWDEDFSNVTSIQHGLNSLSFNTLAANLDLHSLTLRNQPD